MFLKPLFVFFSAILFSSLLQAEGRLMYYIKSNQGSDFLKVEIFEKDGIRSGFYITKYGRMKLTSFIQDNLFTTQIDVYKNTLEVQQKSPTHWDFSGQLWGSIELSKMTYMLAKNGDKYIDGTIAKVGDFKVSTSFKKKSLYMKWNDTIDEKPVTFESEFWSTPKNGQGTCRGNNAVNGQVYYSIKCESSGTLEDALFTSEQDIISWLVQLFLIPRDARSQLTSEQ